MWIGYIVQFYIPKKLFVISSKSYSGGASVFTAPRSPGDIVSAPLVASFPAGSPSSSEHSSRY